MVDGDGNSNGDGDDGEGVKLDRLPVSKRRVGATRQIHVEAQGC